MLRSPLLTASAVEALIRFTGRFMLKQENVKEPDFLRGAFLRSFLNASL
jgi:hypothetical protein